MPVLQPSTSTEIEGPLGGLVSVIVGVSELTGMSVFVGMFVEVETFGVADALVTPITIGVAVNIDGVGVKGMNGVGGFPGNGCITQPLQEVSKTANKIMGTILFIFSPLNDCIPLVPKQQSPPVCLPWRAETGSCLHMFTETSIKALRNRSAALIKFRKSEEYVTLS